MPVEIWINALQHQPLDQGRLRRLTPTEVHERALERRADWLAWDLARPEDEDRIAQAIEADPDLAAALEPRALDDNRIGLVVDDAIRTKLRRALDA